MYTVYGYFYKNKESITLSTDSKRNCQSFIEGWCMDYINNIQGNRACDFNDVIKPAGYILTSSEWNNNIRLWVTKSKNICKYTIKLMKKQRGYLYNKIKVEKLVSIYLVDNKIPFEYPERRSHIEFQNYDELNEVMDVIGVSQNDKE